MLNEQHWYLQDPGADSGMMERHADIPSSSSVPVTPMAKGPKYGCNRSLPTIKDMDAEQGSLGSQGSVDLPVDSGQARLLELGELPQSKGPTVQRNGTGHPLTVS